MQTKTILLDVFSMLHRAYHAIPPFAAPDGSPVGAIYGLVGTALKIVKDKGVSVCEGKASPQTRIVACFDSKEKTYRHEAYEEYKATRASPEDDFVRQIRRCYQFFEVFNIPAIVCPGYEADDIIGTLAEKYAKEGDEVHVATSDNDLLQIVKKNITVSLFVKGNMVVSYDERGVEEKFGFGPETIPDYKGLRGDPSDNIPGVRGIGDIGAKKILTQYGSLEKAYEAVENGDEVVSKRITALLSGAKKDAFFSRDLATISIDAPISQDAPVWEPSVEELVMFLDSLGMKGMIAKVRQQCGGETTGVKEGVKKATPQKNETHLLKKAQVALWVLDSNNTDPTYEKVLEATDTTSLVEALKTLENLLKKEGTYHVFTDIEAPLIDIIEAMQTRGVCVSREKIERYDKVLIKEAELLIGKMEAFTKTSFNPNSPKQVSEVLSLLGVGLEKRTNKGNISTGFEHLKEVENHHPIVPLLLRYRHISKLQTGYTQALPAHIDKNGRVHTSFLQHGTTTGRMASREPNLQNIPNYSKEGLTIRNAFVAMEGYTLASLDYSQMEIRIAALLSKDKHFLSMVEGDKDIHKETAAVMFKKKDVSKKEREHAKRVNFGILYGMGAQALAKDMKVSFVEAKELLEVYKQSFPDLDAYLNSVKGVAHKNGRVSTFFGRRRYFPLIRSAAPRFRSAIERAAINAPIQGTGADMIKIAMIKTATRIGEKYKNKAHLLLQVHDELVFEIDKKEAIPIAKDLQKVMEKEVLQTPLVEFPVSISIGESWGDVKKIS